MKTLVALLEVFLAPVASIVLISIISGFVWTLAQVLGAGNALTALAIDAATMVAVTTTLFGWVFSLPNDIAEAQKLKEDHQ